MTDQATAKTPDGAQEWAIETTGMTRRFGDFVAVDQMDLRIPHKTIYGFLGPNGCGKSTCMRLITGLLTPSAGSIRVLGMEIPAQTELLRRRLGYMTQKFSLYDDLTVLENLRFMAQIYNIDNRSAKQLIASQLSRYQLDERKSRLTSALSGGQRQRLALAAATLHQPELLILDEPTSAVDPENRRDFWEKLFDLCDSGTTILVSTHYMDEAERCHGLAIMESGSKCADGSPAQLMRELGAKVVEVDGENLRLLKQQLAGLPEVVSTAQQGTHLRVLVIDAIDEPETWLRSAHPELVANRQIRRVRPSLEDVFVHCTGSAAKSQRIRQ
ncbi:MAG TPA: ABC transporter ATP-binding protein [Cellvibrio sp.]|nr:ABC transporter ATP-binding protein [Cellvibrio sp.]